MDPKYLIGIAEMDSQHEKILELAARAQSVNEDDFEMNKLVIDLLAYANTNLDQEEAFLRANGLVDFEREHIKKHCHFRTKAMEFYDQFREAETVEAKAHILKTIGSFCEDWLLNHINIEDRAYAKLLS